MKRTSRRAVTALGLTGSLLAFSACGSSSSSTSATSANTGASKTVAANTEAGGTAAAGGGTAAASGPTEKGVTLSVMIGSSGDAETNAVKAATAAWGAKTGNTVNVIVAADLNQQLTQAIAGGSPPDVFYGGSGGFQTLATSNALAVTGDKITDSKDIYPSLASVFTTGGKYYCAPKDFSTLAVEINTDLWTKAGLTDADLPTTWDKLEAAAKKLTAGTVTGLVMGDSLDRLGAFMIEAGGSYQKDGKFTFDSPADLQGLQFAQKLAKDGALKFPKQVGAGWGGEAFGKGIAAMTIEGNWIMGAMKKDYPGVKFKVVPMPAGPTGTKGTLNFTNCWGVAAKSAHQDADVSLVSFLTTVDQQLSFADAFGVMPSRQAAKAQFATKFPEQAAFIDGADYAVGQVTVPGFSQVQQNFENAIQGLSDGSSDPKAMLADLQKNAAALG